jgi:hypothetical protein
MSLEAALLRAGVAQVDITPELGEQLSGSVGALRPASAIADPLYAKAIVFEAGSRKLCIVALDVTILAQPYTSQIRQAAAERWGFEPDAVIVHATQTHSAPGIGYFMVDDEFTGIPDEMEWARGGSRGYSEFATKQAIEAISQAHANLQPARIAAASGIEGRMAHNRRAVQRDGKVFMPHSPFANPLGPTNLLYLEGPIDPELGVVGVQGLDGKWLSLLVSYTCHPVHVFPQLAVSADWPGVVADELRETYGDECIPIVLNGACGNINPWPPFDPDYVYNGDHKRMGAVLADMARKVTATLQVQENAVLDWQITHLKLPFRAPDAAQIEADRAILEADPVAPWSDDKQTAIRFDWFMAASRMSAHLMREREGVFDYEVQVMRVGDAALVGLPGEPFSEGGLRIKAASPTYPTYIVHCTTQYVGYLPIYEGIAAGGHEGNFSYWSKLAPESLDLIVERSVEMLRDVFADKGAASGGFHEVEPQ